MAFHVTISNFCDSELNFTLITGHLKDINIHMQAGLYEAKYGVNNCNARDLSPTVYTRTAYEGYMEWIRKHTTAAGVAFPIPTLSIIIFVVSVSMGI